MANVSFGGGTDPSSTFAYLNTQMLRDIEALGQRASNRSDDRRAAQDADMYDKYKNGLISDQQWLNYIATRVAETKGDPKENQVWVETQRKFETSIADNRAEAKFQAGELSPYGLIDHYQGRMDKLEANSDEWRELRERVFGLQDQVNQDDLWFGAQDITDKIATGKASLTTLLRFYRAQLSKFRPNSDMRRQVEREIRQIESQIKIALHEEATNGTGTGRRRRGGDAVGGMSSTDQLRIATTGSGIVDGNKYRDQLGVSAEARNFSGYLPGMTAKETARFFGARGDEIKQMLQSLKDSGQALLPDGYTKVYATPEQVRSLYEEYADTKYAQSAALLAGDLQGSEDARNAVDDARLLYMIPMADASVDELINLEVESLFRDIEGHPELEGDFTALSSLVARRLPGLTRRVDMINKMLDRGVEGGNDTGVGNARIRGRGAQLLEGDLDVEKPLYLQGSPEARLAGETFASTMQAIAAGDLSALETLAPEVQGLHPRMAEILQVATGEIQRQSLIADGSHKKMWSRETGFDVVPADYSSENERFVPMYMDVGGRIELVNVRFVRDLVRGERFMSYRDSAGNLIDPADFATPAFYEKAVKENTASGRWELVPTMQAWVGEAPNGMKLYFHPGLGPDGGVVTNLNQLISPRHEQGVTPVATLEEVEIRPDANAYALPAMGYLGQNADKYRITILEAGVPVGHLYKRDRGGNVLINADGSQVLEDVPLPDVMLRKRGVGWYSPEVSQERREKIKSEWLGPRNINTLNPTEIMQGGARMTGKAGFGAIAASIGVKFGDNITQTPSRTPAQQAVMRSEAMRAEQQRRLAAFELPTAAPAYKARPSNTVSSPTALPRITLPQPVRRTPTAPRMLDDPTRTPVRTTTPTRTTTTPTRTPYRSPTAPRAI